MTPDLLACDWGTTNVRAWALDSAGNVIAKQGFPFGVASLAPGDAPRLFETEVRPALQAKGVPAILCGTVGAALGWRYVPYVDCPAVADDLVGGLSVMDDADGLVRIIPGVRCRSIGEGPDVMRGEETQVVGWLLAEPARRKGRHVICHPGTHTKWIIVEDGRLTRFVSSMSGELYGVLIKHSLMRSDAPADDMETFDAGLRAGGGGDALAARIFMARARVADGSAPPESTPSFLSGVLIGAEVASVPALLGLRPNEPVALLGDPRLCGLYGRALDRLGRPHLRFDGEAAAVGGMFAIHQMSPAA